MYSLLVFSIQTNYIAALYIYHVSCCVRNFVVVISSAVDVNKNT